MLRLLLVLQPLFMLWMLVDAVRRRAEYRWFLIILLPFGEWIYFFMVKIHDPEFQRLRAFLSTKERPSLAKLRARFDESPSAVNRLALARALHDAGKYAVGAEHFEALLAREATDRDALHGRALCRLGLGDTRGAVTDLATLIQQDPGYDDYAPWKLLIGLLCREGKRDVALSTAAELNREAPRLGHAVLWAQLLVEAGEVDQARTRLAQALRDFEDAPRFVKRRDWRSASDARQLLRTLASRTSSAPTPPRPVA
jgi:hypothetical protein